MISKKLGLGVAAACGVACAPLLASSAVALAAGLGVGGFSTGSLLAGVCAVGAVGVATAMLIWRPQVVSGLRRQAEPACGCSPSVTFEQGIARQSPEASTCSQGQKSACCGNGEPSVAAIAAGDADSRQFGRSHLSPLAGHGNGSEGFGPPAKRIASARSRSRLRIFGGCGVVLGRRSSIRSSHLRRPRGATVFYATARSHTPICAISQRMAFCPQAESDRAQRP